MKEEDTLNKQTASKVYTSSLATAALTIGELHYGLDTVTTMRELANSAERVQNGDINEIEEMLMTQAKTLDFFFYETIAKVKGLEMIQHIQFFTDLALRAQNQSRKTLLALAEIKHPKRTTFIKQQNNAVNQQINHTQPDSFSEKNKKVANELLESKQNEQWLDIGAQTETITVDSSMETMANGWSKNERW